MVVRAILVVLAVAGCSATGLRDVELVVGVPSGGALIPAEQRSYEIAADSGRAYKLFVWVQSGAVDVDITSPSDPAGYLTQHLVAAPGMTLASAPSFTLLQVVDAVYTLTLTAPADSSAQYQLLLTLP